MKKLFLATAITFTFIANPVKAEEKSILDDNGFVGFTSGAVIGTAIAGPVGTIVGATVGILFGEVKEQQKGKEELLSRLSESEQNQQIASVENQQLLTQLNKLKQQNEHLNFSLTAANSTISAAEMMEQLKLNLQFRVNSSEVEPFYKQQIKQLAQLLKQNPQLTVNLNGFADRNGEDGFNLDLSAKRIKTVKALLVAQGVDSQSISTQAFGESAPTTAKQSFQNDFYDRRVEIQLQPQQVLTAGN